MSNRRFLMHFEANNVVNPRVLLTTVLNFNAEKLLLVNTSGQPVQGNNQVTVGQDMNNMLNSKDENGKLYKDYTLIYFKPPESIPGNSLYKGYSKEKYDFEWLRNFKHPDQDSLYIIGPDQYTLPIDMMDLKGKNKLVALEITRNSLWSIVAGGIISRDAFLQDKYGKNVD